MDNDHGYLELDLSVCSDPSMLNASFLGISLFKQDQQLRIHSVKHMTNLLEIESCWSDIMPISVNEVLSIRQRLTDLGCPYFKKKSLKSPSCSNWQQAKCHLYNECTDLVQPLEKAYVTAVTKAIHETSRIPRLAFHLSAGDGEGCLWMMPDRKLIIKASNQSGGYNVYSCYAITRPSTLKEEIGWQRKVIQREARINKNIVWCNPESWTDQDIPDEVTDKKKKKRRLKPYQRIKRHAFRQYLDQVMME